MRKKRNYKREHIPDLKYNNVAIGRFINCLMWDGKKSVAEKVVYDAFDVIKEQTKEDPLAVFQKAFENVSPIVEVASKRPGAA